MLITCTLFYVCGCHLSICQWLSCILTSTVSRMKQYTPYIPLTLLAERHADLLRNALADVYFTSQTGHTNIGRIWADWDTTLAAQA